VIPFLHGRDGKAWEGEHGAVLVSCLLHTVPTALHSAVVVGSAYLGVRKRVVSSLPGPILLEPVGALVCLLVVKKPCMRPLLPRNAGKMSSTLQDFVLEVRLFRISRNDLLKRGGLLNGQKFCNLVLYMALGGMLTLSFQLDLESGRSNSEFDTAAASIRERTSESIERRIGAACHIVL